MGPPTQTQGLWVPRIIEAKSFNLKFTKAGIYNYSFVVHEDNHMFGTIIVEDPNVAVPKPAEDAIHGRNERDALLAHVPSTIAAAISEFRPAKKVPDGSTTH